VREDNIKTYSIHSSKKAKVTDEILAEKEKDRVEKERDRELERRFRGVIFLTLVLCIS
jgi:hypothetical protein